MSALGDGPERHARNVTHGPAGISEMHFHAERDLSLLGRVLRGIERGGEFETVAEQLSRRHAKDLDADVVRAVSATGDEEDEQRDRDSQARHRS